MRPKAETGEARNGCPVVVGLQFEEQRGGLQNAPHELGQVTPQVRKILKTKEEILV